MQSISWAQVPPCSESGTQTDCVMSSSIVRQSSTQREDSSGHSAISIVDGVEELSVLRHRLLDAEYVMHDVIDGQSLPLCIKGRTSRTRKIDMEHILFLL